MLIDIHTHLQSSSFDDDRDAVIGRFRALGMRIVNIGTDRKSSEAAVALAGANADMYATVGQHPTDTNEQFDHAAFAALGADPRVIAVGECGLDYFHEKTSVGREKQKDLFVRQIDLAMEFGKPLMIHCRNAFTDLITLLKLNTKKLQEPDAGVVHFFSGTAADADVLMELGFSFSFGGTLTFASEYEALARHIPMERVLLETDAPYVAPAPHRGKRNEPAFMVETARRMAAVKGVGYDEVVRRTGANAKRVFGI